jgi:hypothetical protein
MKTHIAAGRGTAGQILAWNEQMASRHTFSKIKKKKNHKFSIKNSEN